MKKLKKMLAALLALCMMLSVLPLGALAADTDTDVQSEDAADFIRCFSLDCGRLYFSVDQIKGIIDNLSTNGYTHLALAFGNSGFRFLLNDMAIGNYTSDSVKEAIQIGNTSYAACDGHANSTAPNTCLTETEMDTIIAYANDKNISIIPVLNSPGHMNTIVYAMSELGISSAGYGGSSRSTININSTYVTDFVSELIQKYVTYFNAKGCTMFNLGADEFCNDPTDKDTSAHKDGFSDFTADEKIAFINYVNSVAEMITEAGMTPMMFNDGFAWDDANFNKNIVICYWTVGNVSSSTIANKGYKLINTNQNWYYVLGEPWGETQDKWCSYAKASNAAKNTSVTTMIDDSTDLGSNLIGCMQAFWCDYTNEEYNDAEATKVATLISTLAENNSDYFVVTSSGDGSGDGSGDTGETTGDTVNVELNVGDSITYKNETANAGSYITDENKHIATADVVKTESTTASVNQNVTSITSGSKYLILPNTPNGKVVTSTISNGYYVNANTTWWKNNYGLLIESVTISNDNVEDLKQYAWTITQEGEKYTVQNSNEKYLNITGSGAVSLSDDKVLLDVGWSDSKVYFIADITIDGQKTTYCLNNFGNGNVFASGYAKSSDVLGTNECWTLYEVVEVTEASTTLTITGTGEGTTNVTIGDTAYNITVTAPTTTESKTLYYGNTLSLPEGATNAKITSNENSCITLQNNVITASSDTSGTATVTFTTVNDGGKVTAYSTYSITVTNVDLDAVTPLTYHSWISTYSVHPVGTATNRCNDPGKAMSYTIDATTDGIYSESGVEFSTLVAEKGTWKWAATDVETVFWKGTVLATGSYQENEDSIDKSMSGTDFTYIRYWNGQWSYSSDRVNWTAVLDTDEVCAYYLQETDVTTEVTTYVKDWAFTTTNNSEGSGLNGVHQKALSFAVVYPDGTMNPSEDNIYQNSTLIYWDNLAGLGFIRVGVTDYEVAKITYTFGERENNSNSDDRWTANDSITWNKKTIDETTWYDETVCWDESYGTEPVVNGADLADKIYAGILVDVDSAFNGTWGTDDAILILIYLKPIVTEDSLTVIYYDEKFNDELYRYTITVDSDVNFAEKIVDSNGTTTAWDNVTNFENSETRKDVTGYGIVNSVPFTQYFETDLTKVPDAIGKYNSKLYTYTGSEISEDSKTLYLYYSIDTDILEPNYVIDFGLPITFDLSALVKNPDLVDQVDNCSAKYGTLTYDQTTKIFTYTPTQILPSVDILSITLTFNGETSSTTTNVGVTPATSVFYEESFLNKTGSWEEKNIQLDTQTTEVLGSSSNYGYDSAYENVSSGSYITSTQKGDSANFTFTGTGFQIYANSNTTSGYVTVSSEKSNTVQKVYMVNTVLAAGTSAATENQTGDDIYYSLPIVSETNLDYGTYTVTLYNTKGEPIMIDGVRILGTMQEEDGDKSIYYADDEDHPTFYELRDYVLKAIDVESGKSTYGEVKNLAGQVYNGNNIGEDSAIIINDNSIQYPTDDSTTNSSYAQDLLDNGPKNELFLYADQTLVFKVKTNRVMQLGLKAPTGSANFTLKVNNVEKDLKSLTSCVDMFYEIAGNTNTETEYTVTITVTEGPLSVTLLKICDDPNATFTALTQEDIEAALLSICNVTPEETPTEPEPTEPETTEPEPTEPETTEPEPTEPETTEPETTEPETPVEPETRTTTLTITYVNLFGRKVGTATLTFEVPVGENVTISAAAIRGAAPGRRTAIWLLPVTLTAGATQSIIVPTI